MKLEFLWDEVDGAWVVQGGFQGQEMYGLDWQLPCQGYSIKIQRGPLGEGPENHNV